MGVEVEVEVEVEEGDDGDGDGCHLEAGGVPGEVGGDPEDELVVDGAPAAHAQRRQRAQPWGQDLFYKSV